MPRSSRLRTARQSYLKSLVDQLVDSAAETAQRGGFDDEAVRMGARTALLTTSPVELRALADALEDLTR